MRKVSLWLGAGLGALTSLPLIALFYLGEQWARLPFVPFDLFDWLARVLPGGIIIPTIDLMVRVIGALHLGPTSGAAKQIEQLMGMVLTVIGAALIGTLIVALSRRPGWHGRQIGAIIGIVVLVIIAAIEASVGGMALAGASWSLLWLAILIGGWGALLGALLDRRQLTPRAPEYDPARRALLLRIVGGSLGVAVLAAGAGRLLANQRAASGAGQPLANLPKPGATPGAAPGAAATAGVAGTPTPPLPQVLPQAGAGATATPLGQATTRDTVQPAPGTRPELTANDNFYRIDIDTRPPVINRDTWTLEVGGLFGQARSLTLDDILKFPAITQTVTMSCISNPVGGDLISTSNWTGVRLRDVLQSLGLRPEAKALELIAADQFFESVTLADMMDPRTMLVYGMNGDTLPIEHGFPLRIYIPNHYGMKQPKWIVSMKAVDSDKAGYWVERGWNFDARPQIVSVIDTVAVDKQVNGRVPVGGIAWAGDRGIQKVEVQVDKGAWQPATLRTPPLSPLTWVQWRYDWPATRGRHTFTVRATDGTGALQIATVADTFPDGATGYQSLEVNV